MLLGVWRGSYVSYPGAQDGKVRCVVYSAVSGTLRLMNIVSGHTTSARLSASVEAVGWPLLALSYVVCNTLLHEMDALSR